MQQGQQKPPDVGDVDNERRKQFAVEVKQNVWHSLCSRFVLQMMKHAWDGYAKYAWGGNEVRPSSKTKHTNSIFGTSDMGEF